MCFQNLKCILKEITPSIIKRQKHTGVFIDFTEIPFEQERISDNGKIENYFLNIQRAFQKIEAVHTSRL